MITTEEFRKLSSQEAKDEALATVIGKENAKWLSDQFAKIHTNARAEGWRRS